MLKAVRAFNTYSSSTIKSKRANRRQARQLELHLYGATACPNALPAPLMRGGPTLVVILWSWFRATSIYLLFGRFGSENMAKLKSGFVTDAGEALPKVEKNAPL